MIANLLLILTQEKQILLWNTLLLVVATSLKISALIEIKKEGISWRHDTLVLKEMSKFLLLIWHFYLIYSYIFDIFAKMPILFLWEVGGGGTLLFWWVLSAVIITKASKKTPKLFVYVCIFLRTTHDNFAAKIVVVTNTLVAF